jgi:hypothetical protein
MSDSRNAYDALVSAGVSEYRAREIVLAEVGEDPIRLESVTQPRLEVEG